MLEHIFKALNAMVLLFGVNTILCAGTMDIISTKDLNSARDNTTSTLFSLYRNSVPDSYRDFGIGSLPLIKSSGSKLAPLSANVPSLRNHPFTNSSGWTYMHMYGKMTCRSNKTNYVSNTFAVCFADRRVNKILAQIQIEWKETVSRYYCVGSTPSHIWASYGNDNANREQTEAKRKSYARRNNAKEVQVNNSYYWTGCRR